MIKYIIKKLNDYCCENSVYCIDDILDFLLYYKSEYVGNVGYYEHRWYVLTTNVYKLNIQDIEYYIGVYVVCTIKNECMDVYDCENLLEFYEMEQYNTILYRKKVG